MAINVMRAAVFVAAGAWRTSWHKTEIEMIHGTATCYSSVLLGVRSTSTTSTSRSSNSSPIVPIVLHEKDLLEKFSRSSGPGGQSVNKTNSRVQLTHVPSGITVVSQESRDLVANRKTARRKLKEQLDVLINGKNSKLEQSYEKIRRRKNRARRYDLNMLDNTSSSHHCSSH